VHGLTYDPDWQGWGSSGGAGRKGKRGGAPQAHQGMGNSHSNLVGIPKGVIDEAAAGWKLG
jgi:hypothetical protein